MYLQKVDERVGQGIGQIVLGVEVNHFQLSYNCCLIPLYDLGRSRFNVRVGLEEKY